MGDYKNCPNCSLQLVDSSVPCPRCGLRPIVSFGHENLLSHSISITSMDGGHLSKGDGFIIEPYKQSSLSRSWIIINCGRCPAQLSKVGIKAKSEDLDLSYYAVGTLAARQTLSAFSLLFALYDYFGDFITSFSGTYPVDLSKNDHYDLRESGLSWKGSMNYVSRWQTTVSLIDRVRLADGTIWRYSSQNTIQELGKTKLNVNEVHFNEATQI
jgi:hypothetical protein